MKMKADLVGETRYTRRDENGGALPEPPARLDNCANPIEGGVARYTEYTFFCSSPSFKRRAQNGPERYHIPGKNRQRPIADCRDRRPRH